jgi:hypothetical protein
MTTTTVNREGWTVTASTEIHPRISIQHEHWEPTEFERIGVTTVARWLRTAARAVEAGAGTGSGTYVIQREHLPLVLELVEEVLPQWLREVPAQRWRIPRRDILMYVELFRQYGLPTEPLYENWK